MSRYVKRCFGEHCQGRILGRSSFRKGSEVCRTCQECDPKRRRAAKYASLCKVASMLRVKLARVERERLAIRLELERAS